MALFHNSDPGEFLLFVKNFKTNIEDSGTLAANADIQYLCEILRGEVLCQFDTLCAQVGITTISHLNPVILGLGTYFPPVNVLSKQKSTRCTAE